MNRRIPPEVHPLGYMTMPPETVERLSNGVVLHIVEGGDQPVSRLSIAFSGGTAELGSIAVSRLLLSQTTEGTASRSSEEIADFLDYNGARIGVRPQSHHSVVDILFLNDRAESLLPLWGECIIAPTYPEASLETSKLRSLSAYLASHEEVATLADEAFTELIYGKEHPLGRRLTEDAIKGIGADLLRGLHARMLCTGKIHAFLSGKADRRVYSTVKRLLEAIPDSGSGFDSDIIPMSPPQAPVRINVDKAGAFQNAIVAGLAAPSRESDDYIPLRLTVMALGGYFGSRLMTNIREDKGLTYGISAHLCGCQEGSYMTVAAQCDCDGTDVVIREIGAEMRRLASNPPEGDELQRLKLYAGTNLAEILDTPGSVMSYYANRLFVGTPDDYFERQQEIIGSLSPQMISDMAKKYLDPAEMSVVVAGRNDKKCN